jgi:hypothetical protein
MNEKPVRPYEQHILAAVDSIEAEWLLHWAHYGYTTDRYRKAVESLKATLADLKLFPRYDGVEEYDFLKTPLTKPREESTTYKCPETTPLDMTWITAVIS